MEQKLAKKIQPHRYFLRPRPGIDVARDARVTVQPLLALGLWPRTYGDISKIGGIFHLLYPRSLRIDDFLAYLMWFQGVNAEDAH